jgi:hypothetical protein
MLLAGITDAAACGFAYDSLLASIISSTPTQKHLACQFTIETGPFSARRFLFLLQGIIVQGTAIRMELKTKKRVNAIG